jgi:hypothetical protein
MYLYILEAYNIPSKDMFSKSDPYIVVKVGKKTFNVTIHFKNLVQKIIH